MREGILLIKLLAVYFPKWRRKRYLQRTVRAEEKGGDLLGGHEKIFDSLTRGLIR
jgi:hypothetical protein